MRHPNPHQQSFTRNHKHIQHHNQGVAHLEAQRKQAIYQHQHKNIDNDSGGGLWVVVAVVIGLLTL